MTYQTYKSEIEKYQSKEFQLKQRSNIYLALKLLMFILTVYFGYLFYNNHSFINIGLTFLFFASYLTLCVMDNDCRKKIYLLKRLQTVCKNEISYLENNFSCFNDGNKYMDPEHEFSYDLDLFGKDSLYNRINRTITERGSDKLARKLNILSQETQEIKDNQAAIAEIASLSGWRIKFMANDYISDNFSSFYKLMSNRKPNPFIHSIIPYIHISLTIIFLISGVFGIVSWNFFTAIFLINIFTCIIFSKTLTTTNLDIEKLHKELVLYHEILKYINTAEFQSKVLSDLHSKLFTGETNSLKAFKELSRILNLLDQRGNIIIYVILNGIILFDVIILKRISSWNKKYLSNIEKWMDCIAEYDALVSLGNYAYNNPNNTYAEILPDNAADVIQATDIYHPFLAYGKAVPNNFTLSKGNISIVTGANMAGKSTFLRTIGVNYILACNGAPVCAKVFKFSIVSLFSSMRTTDNLSKDISYFNAELIRLKHLIQHIRTNKSTLIILDEILKGTNSKDKLKGSVIFLHEISKYNIAALIATHDLELAKLEEENDHIYSNYCFEIELSDNIEYSYKIERGIAKNLNASYLLSKMLAD